MSRFYFNNGGWPDGTLGNIAWGDVRVASTMSTGSIAASGSVALTGFLGPANIPNVAASWGTNLQFTITLKVSTANTAIFVKARVDRVNSSFGSTITTGTYGTEQAMTGTLTLTTGATTYGSGSASDRFVVVLSFRNSNSMTAQSAAMATNDASSYIDMSIVVPVISITAQAQYERDDTTPIAVGSASGDTLAGNTKPIYLESRITSSDPWDIHYLKTEIKNTATSFTNSATGTGYGPRLREPYLPVAARGAVMEYDAVNQRYIMIGGYNGSTRFSDLWELSAHGERSRWSRLIAAGATNAPVGKNLGGSVMINQNGKAWFIYWGGSSGSDNNDMRIVDCTTRGSESWTLVTQTSAPAVRSYITHHLVAVPTSSTTTDVYLFGGWGSSRTNDFSKVTIDTSGSVPTALTWSTVTANGAAGSPSARSGGFLWYDAANSRICLHGGYTGSTYLSDLWAYNLASSLGTYYFDAHTSTADTSAAWSNDANAFDGSTSTAATSTVVGSSSVYLSGVGTTAPTSGSGIGYVNVRVYGDVITSAGTTSGWSNWVALSAPSGGWTWSKLNGLEVRLYRQSIGGPSASSTLWADVYDGATLLGSASIAQTGTSSVTANAYRVEVEAFATGGGAWAQLSPTGTAPAGRENFDGGWDESTRTFFLFAGWQGAIGNDRNDIWKIDFNGTNATNGAFTQLRANQIASTDNMGFAAFSSGCSCVDTYRRIIVEFGQNGLDGTDKYVYAWPLDNTETSDATMYGLNVVDSFRGGDAPSFAVDTSRGLGLMSGGFSNIGDEATIANGDHHNEIWEYDYSANTLRYANAGWLGQVFREGTLMVYDSVGDRFLAFGGLVLTSQVTNEIWELKRDTYGNYKARRMKPTGTLPGPRWLMAGAFDAARNRLVIWGGTNSSALYANTDCWQLDLSSGDGAWSSLTPTGTPPPAVWQPGYAYRSSNKRLYVISGATNFAASSFSTRLDYLDLTNATPAWTNVFTTGITGVRGSIATIDDTNGYLFMFSGYNGSVVNSNQYLVNLSSGAISTLSTSGTPTARRSGAGWFLNGKYYITRGRPVSGEWFSDVREMTPNYTTPNSSTWSNKFPTIVEPMSDGFTGLTDNTNYHWQQWINANSVDSSKSSFGGNAETATDFTVGTVSSGTNYDVTVSAAYVVSRTNHVTKTAQYAVAAPVSLTKTAQYLVATPQNVTKSAQYVVAAPVNITKTAVYAVAALKSVTKTAQYTVPITTSFTKSAQYAVAVSNNTTKTAQYTVTALNNITKSAQYAITRAVNLTKGAQYAVPSTTTITKTAQYTVVSATNITKTAQYTIKLTQSLTKSAAYVVQHTTQYLADKSSSAVGFNWSFGDTAAQRLAQQLTPTVTKDISGVFVRIRNQYQSTDTVIAKIYTDSSNEPGTLLATSSNAFDGNANWYPRDYQWFGFTFNPGTTLTASTNYWIVFERTGALDTGAGNTYAIAYGNTVYTGTTRLEYYNGSSWADGGSQNDIAYVETYYGDVQKTAQYVVNAIHDISKTAQYVVLHATDISKTAQYTVPATRNVTKTAQYTVPSTTTVTKTAAYAVATTQGTTKSAQYMVLTTTSLTKTAAYVVTFSTTVTKTAQYVVVSNQNITKSAVYTVPVVRSVTKSAQYTVPTTQTVSKGAVYLVATSTTVTKTAAYLVAITPSAVTKTATYDVAAPVNVTKSAQYTVPFARTVNVSAQYAVATTNNVTKSAAYSVTFSTSLTKSAAYSVTFTTSLTKSAQYVVVSSQNVTKTAVYTVPNVVIVNKSAQYAVATTHDVTKSAQYAITRQIDLTKSALYMVATTTDITKSAAYVVHIPETIIDIQKSAQYMVPITSTINKTASYVVLHSTDVSKFATYAVPNTLTITKSASYVVLTTTSLTKNATYLVATTNNVTKSAQYLVAVALTINKTAAYVVVSTANITKTAQYLINNTQLVQKSAAYVVTFNTTLTKTAQYAITRNLTITKTAQYAIVGSLDITKVATYMVPTVHDIQKSSQYTIPITSTVNKTAQYFVSKSIDITKSATYVVTRQNQISINSVYIVTTGSDKLLNATYAVASQVNLTKTAQYTVPQTRNVTKSATYDVARGLDITKPAVYDVLTLGDLNKTATYRVAITHDVTKTSTYTVPSSTTVSKTAAYVVLADYISEVQKPAAYAVLASKSTTVSSAYLVAVIRTTTKQAQYAVVAQTDIVKSATYRISTTGSITKQASYVVTFAGQVVKNASYSVLAQKTISKLAAYVVLSDYIYEIQKTASYVVASQGTTTKLAQYFVSAFKDIAVQSRYDVAASTDITKVAKYEIPTGQTVSLPAAYAIVKTQTVTVPAEYDVTIYIPVNVVHVTLEAHTNHITLESTPNTVELAGNSYRVGLESTGAIVLEAESINVIIESKD